MKWLMTPPQAKNDEDVADLIEAWEREEEEINRQDASLQLTDLWKMTALRRTLTPELFEHVDLRSGSLTKAWAIFAR